mmetsp:Transcript_28721/g.73677  ORF Transcript_28721/g.73677 Transcript_28721/m.73677 type:complete len:294 (+) Transcript_28721:142-1023(+)
MSTCNETAGTSYMAGDLSLGAHLTNNLVAIAILAFIDKVLLTPMLGKSGLVAKDVSTTRWFFLHSIANVGVVFTALSSLHAVALDPVHALDGSMYKDTTLFGNASVWPLTIINSVHLYHMIGGFRLTGADYFHHMLFIPTLGFPGQVYRWGPLANFQAFFISGLPGGLDYLLLGLVKLGRVDHMLEKRVNANLNTWLRCPGILISGTLLYQALILGQHIVPLWAVCLQLVLPAYNALYFNKQAVANYSVHYMLNLLGQDELIRKHIEERTSWSTGNFQVMSWKDAVGVPQRGS